MSPKKNIIDLSQKKKIAFVCSGGGAKAGAFHFGVALALQEKGFCFAHGPKHEGPTPSAHPLISTYVGSSAGSVICSYLANGYTLDEIFNAFLNKKSDNTLVPLTYRHLFSLKKQSRFFSFSHGFFKFPGFFSTSGVESYLREKVLLTNEFKNLWPDLYIVATQLNHSRKVVFGKYNHATKDKTVVYMNHTKISEACAASTALPLIFEPYPIKNAQGKVMHYFDGEIRDTLSTHVAADAGADLIISSYTHQPYHYSREIGSLFYRGIPAILIQALYLMIESKIQSAIEARQKHLLVIETVAAFFKKHQLSKKLRNECIQTLEKKLGASLNRDYIYIHPKPSDHEMFFGEHFNLSGKKMKEIVRIGFRSTLHALRRIEFKT